ncbi:MAG TPA: hypothetical protein VIG47_02005 [Gemmatimonadaceae bacterium]
MDSYTFSLALGGAGLVAMAATGLSHTGSHPGPAAPSHGGSGHNPSQSPAHSSEGGVAHSLSGHAGHAAHVGSRAAASHAGGLRSALISLASPRTLFSLLVGFGLTGVVARPFLGGIILVLAAVLGAIIFERALVEPVWRFLFRFASNPASTLEDSLMGEAHAASGFDGNGQGLVSLEVDGQIVQCLGTLRPDDLALGVHVRAGDVLRVEDVDATRNRCTVSYVGHAPVSS